MKKFYFLLLLFATIKINSQNKLEVESEFFEFNLGAKDLKIQTNEFEFDIVEVKQFKKGADLWFYQTWLQDLNLTTTISFYFRYSTDAVNWSIWEGVYENPDISSDNIVEDVYYKKFSSLHSFDIHSNYIQLKVVIDSADEINFKHSILKSINCRIYNFQNSNVNDKHYENKEINKDIFKMGGCTCLLPSYEDRSDWGCPDGDGASCPSPTYTDVTHLIVHHEAGSNIEPIGGWDDRVLAIWVYHTTDAGFCDIAYNWLIDHDGVVYEGRGGGDNVQGAHMCAYNQNTMGVCILGNMDLIAVPTQAKDALIEVLAWKACQEGIDPLGASYHLDLSPGTDLDNIAGHKDGCTTGYTECPGDYLYNDLDEIRNSVAECTTPPIGEADLINIDATLSETIVSVGQIINASCAGYNQGLIDAEASEIGYYFSTNCTFDVSDDELATDGVNSLSPGEDDTEEADITIPDNPPGTYYILFVADHLNEVAEGPYENNNVNCIAITIIDSESDLIIIDENLSETNVSVGQVINASCAAYNQGSGEAESSEIGYYFSTNCTWDALDDELATDGVAALSEGEDDTEDADITIPDNPPGTYYILFVADHLEEIDEGAFENNNVTCIAITIIAEPEYPDLIVNSEAVSPFSLEAGDPINLSCNIENIGDENATTSNLKYYISTDCNYSMSDTELGSDIVGILTPGSSSFESATPLIPGGFGPGDYYILFIADFDDDVIESNETNNTVCTAIEIIVTPTEYPDLIVNAETVSPLSLYIGDPISLSCDIENIGYENAVTNNLKYYISNDCNYGLSDTELGSDVVGLLTPGASSFESSSPLIPGGFSPGDYYILFIADFDDDVIESNELNNIVCVAITILEIGSPDLICNINSVTPFLYPGENLDISITIENIGDVSATPEFISRIKLSKDDCILLDDILLENIDVPELIPGGSYTYVQTYSIWDTLSSGNYNLLIKADGPDDILESNESNNTDCSAVEILSPMGCEYTLSSSFQSYDALAYSDNITITTSEIECFWAVTPPPPFWITSITSSGIGFGVISFSIQNNPEITSRSFTFSIESETFTIFQEGLEDDPGVAPVADFYALTLEGCAPLEVSFFDLSSNDHQIGHGPLVEGNQNYPLTRIRKI